MTDVATRVVGDDRADSRLGKSDDIGERFN